MHNLSEIRAKFATLHETKDLVLLKSIFSDLTVKKVGRQVTNINPRDIPVDLFIECAESALQLKQVSIAEEALEHFYETKPPRNQFSCRALYSRALIKSIHAIGKKGEYLIEDTRQAIALCLQGLAIAVSDPAYSFLIYNASVVYHRITRHLFVKGYRHLLAESMQQIVSALETLSEAETDMDWLINFFVNLSICYDEGDSFDAASKTIARAAQLVDSWKAASESLKDKVLRSQVHIFREKGVDFIMNEMDKSSHYSDASRLASAKGTLLLQKIKSGIISDAEVVEDTLHWVLELVGYPAASREGEEQSQGRASRSELKSRDGSRAKKSKNKASNKKGPATSTTSKDDKDKDKENEGDENNANKRKGPKAGSPAEMEKLGVVAETGRLAIRFKLLPLARHCVGTARVAKQYGLHRAWILSEYSQVELSIIEGEVRRYRSTRYKGDIGSDALKERIKGCSLLEQTLRSAERLKNPAVVHEGCALIWNTALPLLQPSYRKDIERSFRTAVTVLENISSPLHSLRAQFHLEMAKCEVMSDFLAMASSHIKKALVLDCTIPLDDIPAQLRDQFQHKTQSLLGFQRPLDRYLKPMQSQLAARQDLYGNTEVVEEQACVIVAQAAEAKTAAMKSTLLLKAVHLLENEEEEAPLLDTDDEEEGADLKASLSAHASSARSKKKKNGRSYTKEQKVARAQLWFDITMHAWSKRLLDITSKGVEKVLSFEWNHVTDKEYVLQQARITLLQCKLLALKVKKASWLPGELSLLMNHFGSLGSVIESSDLTNAKQQRGAGAGADGAGNGDGTESQVDVAQVVFDDPTSVAATVVSQLKTSKEFALEQELLVAHSKAIDFGKLLGEDWIIFNATTSLWNTYLHIFKQQIDIRAAIRMKIDISEVKNYESPFADRIYDALSSISLGPNGMANNDELAVEFKYITLDELWRLNPMSATLLNLMLKAHNSLIALDYKDVPLICKVAQSIGFWCQLEESIDLGKKVCTDVFPLAPVYEKRTLLEMYVRLHQEIGIDENMQLEEGHNGHSVTVIKSIDTTVPVPDDRESSAVVNLELIRCLGEYYQANIASSGDSNHDSIKSQLKHKLQEVLETLRTPLSLTPLADDTDIDPDFINKSLDDGRSGAASQINFSASGGAGGAYDTNSSSTGGKDAGKKSGKKSGRGDKKGNNKKSRKGQQALASSELSSSKMSNLDIKERNRSMFEIDTALWSDLSVLAFKHKRTQISMEASYQCTIALPFPPVSRQMSGVQLCPDRIAKDKHVKAITPTRWRCYAIAECVYGQNIASLIDPERHNKPAQDQIRRQALSHFQAAAYYNKVAVTLAIAKSKKASTNAITNFDIESCAENVLYAAHHFWNTALSLMHDSLTRKVIAMPLRSIIANLESVIVQLKQYTGTGKSQNNSATTHSNSNTTQHNPGNANGGGDHSLAEGEGQSENQQLSPDFRVKMYCLNLQIYRDGQEWKEGYDASTQALKLLPAHLGRRIWEYRVVFMSELGMNVRAGVTKMKNKDKAVQALMWSSLAKSSQRRLDQFDFYNFAIDLLEDEPLEQVDHLITFGEWLFVNNFPTKDAEEYLYRAADILNDIEPDVIGMEEENRTIMTNSIMGSISGSKRGGGSSRGFGGSRIGGSVQGSIRGSVRGATSVSRRGQSRAGIGSSGSVGSSIGNRSPRNLASRGLVSSGSRIGKLASMKGTIKGSIGSVQSMHTDLEDELGMSDRMNIRHLCTLVRIYSQLAMMAPTLKKRADLCLVAQHYVARIWDTAFEAANVIGKRKGFTREFCLPQDIGEWVNYELSAPLKKVFETDFYEVGMTINRRTVPHAALFVHFLQALCDTLAELNYELFTLPVYALMELIASDILANRAVLSLNHLRIAKVMDMLNLKARAAERVEMACPLLPLSHELLAYREEVEQREELKKLSKDPLHQNSGNHATGHEEGGLVKKHVVTDKVHAADESLISSQTKAVNKVEIREVWIDTALLLIEMGKLSDAKFLLSEAHRHCVAFEDEASMAQLHRAGSKIALMEGQTKRALELEYLAQKFHGDCRFWLAGVLRLKDLIYHNGRKDHMQQDSVLPQQAGMLKASIKVFTNIANDPTRSSSAVDARRSAAILTRELAAVIVCDLMMNRLEPSKLVPVNQTNASLTARPHHESTFDSSLPNAHMMAMNAATTGSDPLNNFEAAFVLYRSAASDLEKLKDLPQLLITLLQFAQNILKKVTLSYSRQYNNPYTPYKHITVRIRANSLLLEAAQVLQRANDIGMKQLFSVRPTSIDNSVSLPAARMLSKIKLALSKVHLEIHSQLNPLRIYMFQSRPPPVGSEDHRRAQKRDSIIAAAGKEGLASVLASFAKTQTTIQEEMSSDSEDSDSSGGSGHAFSDIDELDSDDENLGVYQDADDDGSNVDTMRASSVISPRSHSTAGPRKTGTAMSRVSRATPRTRGRGSVMSGVSAGSHASKIGNKTLNLHAKLAVNVSGKASSRKDISKIELSHISDEAQEKAMNGLFFEKYKEVFGKGDTMRKVSHVDRALALASAAKTLASSYTALCAEVQGQMAACQATLASVQRHQEEDEGRVENVKRVQEEHEREAAEKKRIALEEAEARAREREEKELNGNVNNDNDNDYGDGNGDGDDGAVRRKSVSLNVNSIRASVSASSLAGKKKKESREGAAKYAFDPSVWSGQHMYYFSQRKASVIQHVLTAREEKKSARGSKKKGKESKKKAAKKKKEADTDLDASVSNLDLARVLPQAGGAAKGAAATEVIPDFPPFKMGVEHRISSICSYHGCLRHALRQDHDSAIADASMGLLNLYGSQYPNQSAKYLSLHMAAEMRKYALMMYFEASPVSSPEKLVFERLERLQNSQARVSQELVMCKRFLAKFSPTYRRLQLPFLECENGAAASQSPLPETADKASSKAGSPGLSLSLGSLPPASSVMNTAGAACEDPTQLSHLFSIEALNSFLEADYGRVIATLPDNTRVLTFTYSPKLHCLYFTVVSNNQLDTAASRSVLALSEETELVKMVEDWNQIRKSLERHILLHGSTSSASDLDVFNKKYTRITTRLSTAMKPLLEKAYLDHSAAIAGKDVILITDRVLFSLPFEGLSMFQTAKSFTREFSFYLMYQRYRSLPLRLQNGPLIEKESSLISASNLNSHTKQIIKDKVSYVSDPAREDPTLWLPRVFNHVQALFGSNWDGIGGTLSDEERAKMRASAQALKYKRGTKYGIKNRSPNPESASEGVGTDDEEADYSTSSKDDGANLNLPAGGIGTVVPSSLTSTHTPVAGEWQRLLQKSNSFVYLGFERYLSKCSPSDLASLNLTHVTLCYLGDRATNETSYRKQNKIDNQKRPTDRELSSPYNTALLLSLRGVDTVVLHQYAISSSAAGYEFCNVWDSLKLGASMGEAVQNFRTTRNEHDSKSSAVSSLMSDMRSLMAPSSREARSLALPKTPTKRPIKSPRGASKAGRDRSIRPRSTISARQHANLLEYFEGSLRIYDRYNCIVVGLSDVRY